MDYIHNGVQPPLCTSRMFLPHPIKSLPTLPSPKPLAAANLLSVSIDCSIPDISRKQNHTTRDLLRLASSIPYHVFEAPPGCRIYQNFTWKSTILLHGYTTFCLSISIHQLRDIHNNLLATVNSAVMNTDAQVFAWIHFNFRRYIPRSWSSWVLR